MPIPSQSRSTRRVFGAMRSSTTGWLLERATAIVLVPLTVWFVAALIAHAGSDHAALITWLRSPFNAGMMALLLIVLFWHTALGLGVVIKDYVHDIKQRRIVLIAMRLACLALSLVGIVAVAQIAFATTWIVDVERGADQAPDAALYSHQDVENTARSRDFQILSASRLRGWKVG